MKETILNLPYPPTVNTYWRNISNKGRPRVLISKKGREYRQGVHYILNTCDIPDFGDDKLKVSISVNPPDKRRRDLDNLPKAVLDALQKAGVYTDDSNIDDLRIVRQEVIKGGGIQVHIEAMG